MKTTAMKFIHAVVAVASLASASAEATPLNPSDFTSLGTFTAAGTVTANTDTLIMDGFNGVLFGGTRRF